MTRQSVPQIVDVKAKTLTMRRTDYDEGGNKIGSVLSTDVIEAASSLMESHGFERGEDYRVEYWHGSERNEQEWRFPNDPRMFQNNTVNGNSTVFLRVFAPGGLFEFGPFIHSKTNDRKRSNRHAARAMFKWVALTAWMIDTVPMIATEKSAK